MQFRLLFIALTWTLSGSMDQWGREFLVTFVPNYDQTGENAIYITARADASVYVQNDLYSISHTLAVTAYSSVRLTLTADLHYTAQAQVQMKAVYVNSTADISVYAVNYRASTAGLHTVFPLKTMGTHYLLFTYTPTYGAYFVISALYDDTDVSVQLSVAGGGTCLGGSFVDGQTATASLSKHSVWGGMCGTSFSGSVVTSTKPVTVLVGMACDTVPLNVKFCDHMAEMMPPVEDFGSTFILHDMQYRTSGVIYRVYAAYDNTVITQSTGGTVTLNTGEFTDYDLQTLGTELCVTSSAPALVLMMAKGGDSDPAVAWGDPHMAVVPPAENYTTEYVVNLEITTAESFNRYIAVTVKDGDVAGVVLPTQTTFTPIGCGYSVGHVALDANTHWLRHSSGASFGVMMYAFANGVGLASPAGFQLLDKYDYCMSTPCLNNATCSSNPAASSYVCTCVAGYTGNQCETDINECIPDPCLNGATCVDLIDGYSCTCVAGYTGTQCETDVDDCTPDPCVNGGTCTDLVNGYSCTCVAGYTGTSCETDINDCSPSACLNGATCTDLVNSYNCTCVAGYTGTQCETDVDDCAPSPCLNGGTCTDLVNGYNCTCEAGYTGTQCETDVDDCTPNPCLNGGTCADLVNGYSCSCVAGYTGSNCQTDIDNCNPNPCLNGATCVDLINSYYCNCLAGFTGGNCELAWTTAFEGTTLAEATTDELSTQSEQTSTATSPPSAQTDSATRETTSDSQTTVTSLSFSTENETQSASVSTDTVTLLPQTTVSTPDSEQVDSTVTSTDSVQDTSVDATDHTVASTGSLPGDVTTPVSQGVRTTASSGGGTGECLCNCRSVALANLTQEELVQRAEEQAEQIKKELAVDKAHLSSTIRKVTSAPDDRPSATGIGYVGIIFLVLSFGAIVVMDLTGYFHIMHAPPVKEHKKST